MVKIPDAAGLDAQYSKLGTNKWRVSRLIQLAKDLPVMDVPLDHLNVYNTYERLSLRQMVMHMRQVLSADMTCPIILDEDGDLMDGRHRVMRALLEGHATIKAVRFEENPIPCYVE